MQEDIILYQLKSNLLAMPREANLLAQ